MHKRGVGVVSEAFAGLYCGVMYRNARDRGVDFRKA